MNEREYSILVRVRILMGRRKMFADSLLEVVGTHDYAILGDFLSPELARIDDVLARIEGVLDGK